MSVILDTGALIAVERHDQRMLALLDRVRNRGDRLLVGAGVLAQAWRGPRQARLARLLGSRDTEVVALDELSARMVGSLLARSGTSDVVDGHVAVMARQSAAPVVTADADDLRRLDPGIEIFPL